MKIVFLARMYAPHKGGVERHVEGLAKELVKRGHEITVVTEQYAASLPLKQNIKGVAVVRIPRQKLATKRGVWSWMKEHQELFEAADIIHAHDVFWWYLPLRFRFWSKPVYTTFHGYERESGPTLTATLWRLLADQLSDGSIAIGDWMREWYSQHPDIVSYGAADAAKKSLPKKYSSVFIGRLEEDTGILKYIAGVKTMKRKIAFDIFGEGPLKKEIAREIRGSKTIRLRGTTENPAKEFASHRFVFSSQYLGMLEAQQVGRQVFAYRGVGLKPDYLKSFPTIAGVKVFSSAEELAKQVEEIIHSPKIETANIIKANTWAKKQTWRNLTDQYENLWKK